MKNETTIPVTKVADLVAANKRSFKYALKRDLQALEFNEAIVTRQLSADRNIVKCEKCGKEFSAGSATTDSLFCPNCK